MQPPLVQCPPSSHILPSRPSRTHNVASVQWPPASVAIATNHTSGPAIVALWTTGDVDDSLLTWLVQTPSKISLRYVGFWDRTDKVPGWWRDAIARFMRAVGSRLTYLELPTLGKSYTMGADIELIRSYGRSGQILASSANVEARPAKASSLPWGLD